MAKITIDNKKISETAWGDVDKTSLGNRLASAYADGNATKAVIREAYANVPDDAFSTDSDGNKKFSYTKAWGPHHELKGDTLVVNRGGVFAAAQSLAGARSEPKLTAAEKAKARRHLRKHYRAMEEEIPDSLSESMGAIEKGQPIEELVKGSMEYTLDQIRRDFYKQFPRQYDSPFFYLSETFADHVIVSHENLKPDEYYLVTYERSEGKYVFADMDDWEVVELAYQPQTELVESVQSRRFVDTDGYLELAESKNGEWRVKGIGLTADVINGNGRRYPPDLVEAAVLEAKTHLNESLGQGRLQILGEVEHPSSKSGRPNLLETVFNWTALSFVDNQVIVEGIIPKTSLGRDIHALMESKVKIPLSQRAYGKSVIIKESGRKVEVPTELHITGYDATAMPSDPFAGLLESLQEDQIMELNLEVLKEKYPGLVAQLEKEHDEKKRKEIEEQLKARQEEDDRIAKMVAEQQKELREQLGLKETDDLLEAVKSSKAAQEKLAEQERQKEIDEYIDVQTKDWKYDTWLLEQTVERIKDRKPATIEEAKEAILYEKKFADKMAADGIMAGMGRKKSGVDVIGPVLEETGTPEFARVSFELTESIRQVDLSPRRNFKKPKTVNEEFAALYLKKFDEQYKVYLQREAREFAEAEQTSDLNLPYSVSRAIVAEAFPRLVSSGIFDFGLTDQAPTRIYFEKFAGETGYTASVTDESITSDEEAWVALANKRLTPGTVVVTTDPAGTTYTEGTDYVIDYANGELYTLAGGSIGDAAALLVDYSYTAIRKGELATIERGKVQLTFETMEIAADRLATEISREAIVFSRSQLGWDATARTLASLVRQVQRKIDQGVIYLALAAALRVASNSGGTWTAASDTYLDFVEKTGAAKVKVINRFYDPTFILLSTTNGDRIGNWDGFTQAGSRPDSDLNANGFIGRLKGLPVFQSTEMSDGYELVGNRELVMHRVYQAMQFRGPYPTYDATTGELIASDQYYAEEFNGSEAPVPEKGAYIVIA